MQKEEFSEMCRELAFLKNNELTGVIFPVVENYLAKHGKKSCPWSGLRQMTAATTTFPL